MSATWSKGFFADRLSGWNAALHDHWGPLFREMQARIGRMTIGGPEEKDLAEANLFDSQTILLNTLGKNEGFVGGFKRMDGQQYYLMLGPVYVCAWVNRFMILRPSLLDGGHALGYPIPQISADIVDSVAGEPVLNSIYTSLFPGHPPGAPSHAFAKWQLMTSSEFYVELYDLLRGLCGFPTVIDRNRLDLADITHHKYVLELTHELASAKSEFADTLLRITVRRAGL